MTSSTNRPPSNSQLNAAEQWLTNISADVAKDIESAWQAAIEAPGDFAADFYAGLFKAAPGIVELFPGDMTEQQQRLTHSLAEVVALVHQPDQLMLLLRATGVRHHHYHVRNAYFNVMRNVLIDTIEKRADKKFNFAHRHAWENFFDNMAVVMQHGMASAVRS